MRWANINPSLVQCLMLTFLSLERQWTGPMLSIDPALGKNIVCIQHIVETHSTQPARIIAWRRMDVGQRRRSTIGSVPCRLVVFTTLTQNCDEP